MQVKWIIYPLVLVRWNWNLNFIQVQQEKPSRIQIMLSPSPKWDWEPVLEGLQGLWLSMWPCKYKGLRSCISTLWSSSRPLQGPRQEATRLPDLPEHFCLHQHPACPAGLSGTHRRDFHFHITVLETTESHRNITGIWSAGTNKRAWLKYPEVLKVFCSPNSYWFYFLT